MPIEPFAGRGPWYLRLLVPLTLLLPLQAAAEDLRIGIIGTDISHVIQFSRILNNATDPEHIAGARIVAAYKGGSPDIVSSRTRVDNYAKELVKTWGIEMVPDIPALCSKVDAIVLESGDGRIHLAQVKPVIAAHKPVFIDKPVAATLEDVREIDRLAKAAGVPWFSSSGLRFGQIVAGMKFPDITGVQVWGPGPFEEHHYLELAWYAIHPIEMLYTLMGPGCDEVTRMAGGDYTSGSDVVVGRWKDGRIGSVRTLRPSGDYGAVVFRPKQIVQSQPKVPYSYAPLVRQIVTFFETRKPPVPNEETLEIYAFMDAAQRSKEAGGKPMRLR
jgi:Oxidoreductase family, NAD-binding Rossmann fold